MLKSKLEFESKNLLNFSSVIAILHLAVAEPTAKDIEQILVERGKMDSIFRGTFCIPGSKNINFHEVKFHAWYNRKFDQAGYDLRER